VIRNCPRASVAVRVEVPGAEHRHDGAADRRLGAGGYHRAGHGLILRGDQGERVKRRRAEQERRRDREGPACLTIGMGLSEHHQVSSSRPGLPMTSVRFA
jgi:hypothetical protein